MTKYTEQQKLEILTRMNNGETACKLGNEYNIPASTIHYWKSRECAVSQAIRDLSLQEVEIVKSHYLKGVPIYKIANYLGVARYIISNELLKSGITIQSYGDIKRKVSRNPFLFLNDESCQYWLGFISADGNLCKGNIRLQIADYEHLIKYQEFIGDLKVSKDRGKYWSCNFSNPTTYDWLIWLGITPKKSSTLKLNLSITPHILRGYFDGNGYVSKSKKGLLSVGIGSSSYAFIKQIEKFLLQHNICIAYSVYNPNYIRKDGSNALPYHRLTASSRDNVTKLYNLMYSDASIFLERKQDKFVQYFSKMKK